MSNKLLSICIPTYNRPNYLNETIKSIISQKIFIETNDIEIIISDNSSDDETENVLNNYLLQYPNKIFYYKNDENIGDKNFEKVLSLATGLYLKLNNDTLYHTNETLEYIVHIIKKNINNKPVLFFSNSNIDSKCEYIETSNLEKFINIVSYQITWIGSFGIWREDFKNISNFNRYSKLQLLQVDVILRNLKLKNKAIIYNKKLFTTLNIDKKGGYDLITVFLDNFLFILNEYKINGDISEKSILKLKKKIVNIFIFRWVFLNYTNTKYNFQIENLYVRIKNHCKEIKFTYYIFIFKLKMLLFFNKIYFKKS
jgi:abequosyltransferase